MSAWCAYRGRVEGIAARFMDVALRPENLDRRALIGALLESRWQRMNVSEHIAAFDRALGRRA